MEFDSQKQFVANDSLDEQLKIAIQTGTFPLHLLSLIAFVGWIIYLSFYNSRLTGAIISIIIRRFVKNYHIKIGSISVSALTGKFMIRDLLIVTDDYTVHCHDIVIIFNYWTSFNPSRKLEPKERCLHVYMYGLDVHLYNRAQVYDDLKVLFASQRPRAPPRTSRKKRGTSSVDPFETQELDPEETKKKTLPTEFNDRGRWNWRDLFPVIKFEIILGKLCFGNSLIPNAFCLTADKLLMQYGTREARYKFDRFQHHVECEYTTLTGTLCPTLKYTGHYVVEDLPRNFGDGFQVFQWGKGKITYYMDEPGIVQTSHSFSGVVSLEPERVQMSDGNVSVKRTFPEWKVEIKVTNDCRINYGPWADRQREILWKFFFPASYESMQPTAEPLNGSLRQHKKLKIVMHTDSNAQIDVMFAQDKVTQAIHLEAKRGSYFKATIPWLVGEKGFTTVIQGALLIVDGTASHVCRNMLRAEILGFVIKAHYPLVWNAYQSWDIDLEIKSGRLNLVFDHKRYFKAMIDEWTRGSKPDLISFIPFTYNVNITGDNFELVTMANDYNWIAPNHENAHLSFFIKKLQMDLKLDFHDFLPDVVTVPIAIKGEGVTARISIPETSTALYTLLELHSHMQLVDRQGQPMPQQTLFQHTEEVIQQEKKGEKRRCRHWLDCWDAPHIRLKISYAYHPMPWVEDVWKFLHQEYRSHVPAGGAEPQVTFQSRASRRASKSKRHKIDTEEAILSGLRPEGRANGPTADYLRLVGFDPAYMEPDQVEVEVDVPSSNVALYGSLLRNFLHVKENYFGSFQDPVSFEKGIMEAHTNSAVLEDTARECDPRYYRPFAVKVNVKLHDIQAHLLKHCSSTGTPCPSAFIDCIGFELNKRYEETKLQVLVAPIVIVIMDNHRNRPEHSKFLNEGSLVLQGLQVRGHAMFSHEDLPLDNETLEYAWLVDLSLGELTGQLTALQLKTVVQCVQTFVFLVADHENDLQPSRNYDLCQHGYPQAVCPQWLATHKCLCPREADLKYKFIRLSVDGVDVQFVECDASLNLCSDPIRLATCDLHGQNNKEGISAILPRVSLMQYVRPVVSGAGTAEQSDAADRSSWLEAGSLCVGPILVNAGIALPLPEYRQWQDAFLRRHDKSSKRLWFLWSDKLQDKGEIVRKCGCFGGCAFFGENESGRTFLAECYTNNDDSAGTASCSSHPSEVVYPRRTVMPCVDEVGWNDSWHFAESILEKRKFLFDLHDPAVCCEDTNGIFLLREKRFWPSFGPYKQYSRSSLQSMTEPLVPHEESFPDSLHGASSTLHPQIAVGVDLQKSSSSISPPPVFSVPSDSDDEEGLERAEETQDKRYISLHSLISDSPESSSTSEDFDDQEGPQVKDTSAAADEDPAEDWEDLMAKYVDLRSQLNSHITESSLLFTAYRRHLSQFDCGLWAVQLRLKSRWTRLQALRHPQFSLRKDGFSPRSMIDRAKRGPLVADNQATASAKLSAETRSSSKDFLRERIAELTKDSQSSTPDSSARSTATVRLQRSVDLLLTPMLLECMQRYIEVLTPELSRTHPSTVVDNLHVQCVQSTRDKRKPIKEDPEDPNAAPSGTGNEPSARDLGRGQQPTCGCNSGAGLGSGGEGGDMPGVAVRKKSIMQLACELHDELLYGKQTHTDSSAGLSATTIQGDEKRVKRTTSIEHDSTVPTADAFASEAHSLPHIHSSGIGTIDPQTSDQQTPSSVPIIAPTPSTGLLDSGRPATCGGTAPTCSGISSSDSGPIRGLSESQAGTGKEDWDGAPKLSAVEDLVHSDTITSGLHDLTCVSLLAFCLDSASFEVLINQKREAITDFDTFNREKLRQLAQAKQEAASKQQRRHHENPLSFVASAPSTSSKSSEKAEGSATGRQATGRHDRDPEMGFGGDTATGESGEDGLMDKGTGEENGLIEEAGGEGSEFRWTEELISNIEIKRIHVQLRRLTKSSHFSGEVLLTAIPFRYSKVLFAFESDPEELVGLGSARRLEERSAGWIMFECGLEQLTLTCVRRRGFNEGVDDYAKLIAEKSSVKIEQETEAANPPPKKSETEFLDEEDVKEKKRNAFLSRLHVKTVWLNFPAPKRLPNKRRIDITRYDWNLLSTATPTIKAWMNPSDGLISASKQLKTAVDRRTLSVTACLMTQAISKDSDDSTLDERFNISKMPRGKDKALPYYDQWRTVDSRALRYEPTCQIFTVLRRYMRQKPERVVEVERWLREDTLPQTVTLQRGILALTRDWRYYVDVYHHMPTVPAGNTTVPVGFTFGGGSGGHEHHIHTLNHAATATSLLGHGMDMNVGSDEETGSVNNMRLGEDDNPLSEPTVRSLAADDTENPIMRRFLWDANPMEGSSSQQTTGLGAGRAQTGTLEEDMCKIENENLYNWCARKQQNTGAERDRGATLGSTMPATSATMNSQFKQAVHLRAQFQYMEDAQKLFRPLLEAVGLHVKGIRRTTLMKKFGGFFSADGLLETFEIDIVQSEGNPLKQHSTKGARTAQATGFGEVTQSAFLCKRFASKITMRDVIGFEKQHTKKMQQPDTSQVDIKPTTTQVNMLLHIDHMQQHVNMPLLRLVHQFVTMIYCARDTREELEKKRDLYDLDFCKQHRKQDSKGSSNGTDTTGSTMKSKSSAHARHSEETTSSGGPSATTNPAAPAAPLHIGTDVAGQTVTFAGGKSMTSSPSLAPDPQKLLAEYSEVVSGAAHDETPQCWRRLYNLVELCATVPETKTVFRKTPQSNLIANPLPVIEDEEATNASSAGLHPVSMSAGVTPSQEQPPSLPTSTSARKKDHRRSHSLVGLVSGQQSVRTTAVHAEDVEMGLLPGAEDKDNPPGPAPAGVGKSVAMQRFTYQWFHGERVPILIFASAKVRKMDMSAVLSELKLDAGVLNIHGSFTHMTRLRGRGNFTEKSSQHSLTAHCGDSEVLLREGSYPDTTEVVRIQGGRCHFLLSCERTKKGEKNSAVARIGRIVVVIPHHPVKLHDMMQRNAKRLSSTMSEFLRSTPTNQRQRPTDPLPEEAFPFPGLQKTKLEQSRPLLVSLSVVAQGLNVTVALHPTLDAVYQIDPVYLVGKIGTNGHVEVSLAEHSLSFKSSRPPPGFPRAVNIHLPHIILSVNHRYSNAGPYQQGHGKLTEGLTQTEGRYIDALATVATLEQTLTTDLLNYVVVVVKLFMKEINEVIQKMAGEEQGSKSTGNPDEAMNTSGDGGMTDGAGGSDSRLLSRAARGNTLFTFRVKMVGIRLIATAHTGAVKVETLDIEVELSNRVLAAGVCPAFPNPMFSGGGRGAPEGNKNRHKSRSLPRRQTGPSQGGSDRVFVLARVGSVSVEIGQLDQDLLYNERSPEFKTHAFFKTAIALRSLLSDEMIPTNQGEQEAFLIQLIRPIIWVKPTAFDRAILLWVLYKNEFEKWNAHMRTLSSQVQTPTQSGAVPGVTYRARQPNPPPSTSSPSTLSTLYLQLTIDDLGICLPTGPMQNQSLESESRTALVLTLESSRISACFRGALASEGEFSGFCVRFDDEFNMGSDDWKPDPTRNIIQVGNDEKLVIMNACVVPNGTFQVCSRTFDKLVRGDNAKWILNVVWKMCGLDVHLDVNISRKLKVIFATLTSMTGYDDTLDMDEFSSPPVLNDTVILGGVRHPDTFDGRQGGWAKLNEATYRLDSLIDGTLRSPRVHQLRCGEDQYDSDIRNIESQRQHIQMLEAQMCKTYKRSKWNNFLKKSGNPPIVGKIAKRSVSLSSGGSKVPIRGHAAHQESLKSKQHRSTSTVHVPVDEETSTSSDPSHSLGSGLLPGSLQTTATGSDDDESVEDGVWEDAVAASPSTRRVSSVSNTPTTTKRPSSLPFSAKTPPVSRGGHLELQPQEVVVPGGRPPNARDSAGFRFSRAASVYYDTYAEMDENRAVASEEDDNSEDDGDDTFETTRPSSSRMSGRAFSGFRGGTASSTLGADEPKEPNVDLELDIRIHVDSGNCVLHPKLASVSRQDERKMGKVPTERGNQGNNFASNQQTEDQQLSALLHRYKLHLTQSQKSMDITVFYLPAVDIKLHYNSKIETENSPSNTMTSTAASLQRNRRKRADLYAFCSLQKLPKDLVVNPSLLDFLEQAFDNIPLFPEWKSEKDSVTASEQSSSSSLLSSKSETFPVDVVVHINVQPSIIRFTCLPTSPVQCLMSLPFLDLVFSTKRNQIDINPATTVAEAGVHRGGTASSLLTRSMLRSRNARRSQTLSASSEPLSEGGLCVSGVLKEFKISVFHPYGTNRGEGSWDSGSADSLTLVVQNICVNISRTRETTVVAAPSTGQQSTGTLGGDTLPPPTAGQGHAKQGDSLCLNNNVRFSGVCDIGCAQFKYDTRRTLEILAIPNAWYRSKLARRLFLGEETTLASTDNPSDAPTGQSHPTTRSATPSYDSSGGRGGAPFPILQHKPSHHRRLSSGDRLLKQRFPKTSTGSRLPSTPPDGAFPQLVTPRGPHRKPDTLEEEGGRHGAGVPLAGPGDRKEGSGAGSLGVASWQTLLVFCTNLKRLEVEMYMGSAMGVTKLNVDQLYCSGRAMMDSSKRKNTNISVGLGRCEFTGEGGIVGGEFSICDLSSNLHIYEDPQSEPEHGLGVNLGGFEVRLEYMNTNILFGRVSTVVLRLHDEWRLRDHTKEAKTPVPNPAAPVSNFGAGSSAPATTHSMVIVVVGEMSWDQLQLSIARTTTPDLVKSMRKLKDYFQEQVREGRRTLLSNDWTGVAAARSTDRASREAEQHDFISKIYQRHWQSPFLLAAASSLRLINSTQSSRQMQQAGGATPLSEPIFVLGGSLQLAGRSMGVACFTGNFRSAADWAVFNVQHPTVCFETEAQRDHESSGGRQVHVRQVLSFDLGEELQHKPQMAYVIKANRGREGPTKNPQVTPTVDQFFEFAFRAADERVLSFVKQNEPSMVHHIVQLTRFPDVFQRDESAGKRPNPFRVSTESDILFVLPSISLRLTTDHQQSMELPVVITATVTVKKPEDSTAEHAEKKAVDDEMPQANVQMSFQTDFHGLLHLGLADVSWLPRLIGSYISEKIQDADDVPDPDLSKRASTGSPIVHDIRRYAVVHWELSPKCRWLLANNLGVPAFDKILENIGFRKARTTIPKWLQRGIMDHLDLVLSLLVERIIKLMKENEEEDDNEGTSSSSQATLEHYYHYAQLGGGSFEFKK